MKKNKVSLIPIDKMPSDVKKLDRKELAFGEVTGHAHRIDVGELFETRNGELYLKVKKTGKVSHEEHKTLELKEGVYHVNIKRQHSPEGWTRVRD